MGEVRREPRGAGPGREFRDQPLERDDGNESGRRNRQRAPMEHRDAHERDAEYEKFEWQRPGSLNEPAASPSRPQSRGIRHSFRRSRPVRERIGRARLGRLAILECKHAVHDHLRNARRVLMRLGVRGVVLDFRRVEHDDVGEVTCLEAAAVAQVQDRGRLSRHAMDRVLKRDKLLVSHVAPEHPSEVAVGARMRSALQEDSLGRERRSVRAEIHVGQCHLAPHLVFGHQEIDRTDSSLVLGNEIHRRFLRTSCRAPSRSPQVSCRCTS